jgi:hypothetical protein
MHAIDARSDVNTVRILMSLVHEQERWRHLLKHIELLVCEPRGGPGHTRNT